MKVIKNWGKLVLVEVDVPPVTMPSFVEGGEDIVLKPGRKAFVQGTPKGDLWYLLTKDIKIKPTQWFIAVHDGDGWISMCESDPTMVSLVDYEIIQIETPLPRDDIFCQKWTGKEVVPWVVS